MPKLATYVNKKNLGLIISILLIAIFLWYFVTHINDFGILLKIDFVFVILLICTYIGGIVINGIFMKWSIALFGKNIKFIESIRVSLISTVGNFFAPAGSGLAFRAVYLKKRHSLAYSDYTSIVFCNYIFAFLVNAILGLVALYVLRSHYSNSFIILAIFFIILLIASITALFLRVNEKNKTYKNKLVARVMDALVKISNGWRLILTNKKLMLGLFGLMIANTALLILSTYFIMSAIGIQLSVASLVLFSALGSLSVFINITPGNLGVKEAIYIIFSTVIGLTTAQILSAALIDRVVLFTVIFLLWLVYGRNIHSFAIKKQEQIV
jgi:uncharacterized protein (TIRG00374 family)